MDEEPLYTISLRDENDELYEELPNTYDTEEEAIKEAKRMAYESAKGKTTVYEVRCTEYINGGNEDTIVYVAINKPYKWCVENNIPLIEEYGEEDYIVHVVYDDNLFI